jgi:hypothetical protein
VPIRRELAQVVHGDVDQPTLPRAGHDPFRQTRLDGPWKDRDDIELHINRES